VSADNYYRICRHPRGGYAAIMGFMSNGCVREVIEKDHCFATWQEAYNYASRDYTEYGISLDPDILAEHQDPHAYIMNARAELAALRSDVVNELSDTPGDFYLRAAFLSYIDAADSNLQKALR
jgi:hypothetical protein